MSEPKTAAQHNAELTGSYSYQKFDPQLTVVKAQQNGWLQCADELEKILQEPDFLERAMVLIKTWRWAGKLGRV